MDQTQLRLRLIPSTSVGRKKFNRKEESMEILDWFRDIPTFYLVVTVALAIYMTYLGVLIVRIVRNERAEERQKSTANHRHL